MDERGLYLQKKTESSTNLYKGNLIKQLNPRYIKIYPSLWKFFETNPTSESYLDKDIIELTSDPNFIVSSETLPIIFISGLSRKRLKSLKLHIVENFLVNWETDESNAMTNGFPGNDYGVTYATITDEELFDWSFKKITLEDERLYSDVQFIVIDEHPTTDFNGHLDRVVRGHINTRNVRGLITIILYCGSILGYKKNNYELSISRERTIIRRAIKLTKEEEAFLNQHKGSQVTQEELDKLFEVESVSNEEETKTIPSNNKIIVEENEYTNRNKNTNYSMVSDSNIDPFV